MTTHATMPRNVYVNLPGCTSVCVALASGGDIVRKRVSGQNHPDNFDEVMQAKA